MDQTVLEKSLAICISSKVSVSGAPNPTVTENAKLELSFLMSSLHFLEDFSDFRLLLLNDYSHCQFLERLPVETDFETLGKKEIYVIITFIESTVHDFLLKENARSSL